MTDQWPTLVLNLPGSLIINRRRYWMRYIWYGPMKVVFDSRLQTQDWLGFPLCPTNTPINHDRIYRAEIGIHCGVKKRVADDWCVRAYRSVIAARTRFGAAEIQWRNANSSTLSRLQGKQYAAVPRRITSLLWQHNANSEIAHEPWAIFLPKYTFIDKILHML